MTTTKVISTCKKDRVSTWGNKQPRRCTEGMKMVVEHTVIAGGKIKSVTKYV